MNSGRSDRQYISRREVLAGAELALGAATATAVSQAAAQQKISQTDAKYQPTPKNDQRCGSCYNFQPPNACIGTTIDLWLPVPDG